MLHCSCKSLVIMLSCYLFYSPRSRRSHQHYQSNHSGQYQSHNSDFETMSERQQRSYHHSRMAAAAQQQHQVSQAAPSNLSQSILSQHPHLFNAATSNHLQQAATAAAAAHQSNAAASMNTPHQPRPYFIDLSQIRQVWLSNQNSAQ